MSQHAANGSDVCEEPAIEELVVRTCCFFFKLIGAK